MSIVDRSFSEKGEAVAMSESLGGLFAALTGLAEPSARLLEMMSEANVLSVTDAGRYAMPVSSHLLARAVRSMTNGTAVNMCNWCFFTGTEQLVTG